MPFDPYAYQGNSGNLGVIPTPPQRSTTPNNASVYSDNPFDPNSAEGQAWIQSKKNQLINFAGAPTMPTFQEPTTNPLGKDFQMTPQLASYNPDNSGIDALKERALATGPSAWANLQLEGEAADRAKQLGNAQAQGAGNQATAESNLAMRGGLSSGARERLARGTMESGNATAQNINSAGEAQRLGIQSQDETNKLGLLSQLPGAQLAASGQALGASEYNTGQQNQASQYNISNALNDVLQKRAYDVNAYNEQMKAFGAGKTADAAANSGGGKK